MSRALRRHHRNRIKNKRSKIWWIETQKQLRIAIDTPCRCSCMGCGNPRRHFGTRTIQELRYGRYRQKKYSGL